MVNLTLNGHKAIPSVYVSVTQELWRIKKELKKDPLLLFLYSTLRICWKEYRFGSLFFNVTKTGELSETEKGFLTLLQ